MSEAIVSTIDLPGGSLLPFAPGDQASVRILKGRVWITEEGSPGDVFLASGEQSPLHGSGRVVIEALSPTRIELIELPRLPLTGAAARLARAAFVKLGRGFRRLRLAVVRATAPGQAGCTVR